MMSLPIGFESPWFLAAVPLLAAAMAAAALRRRNGGIRPHAWIFAAASLAAVAAASPFARDTGLEPRDAVFVADLRGADPAAAATVPARIARISSSASISGARIRVAVLGKGLGFADLTGLPREEASIRVAQAALAAGPADGCPPLPAGSVLALARAGLPGEPAEIFFFSAFAGPPDPAGGDWGAVHAFTVAPRSRRDLALVEIRPSGRIREGEPFMADVRYSADFSSEGRIALSVDGKRAAEKSFSFAEGDLGSVTFGGIELKQGRHRIEAAFETGDDFAPNDSVWTDVESSGRLSVLLAADGPEAALYAAALAAQDIRVTVSGYGSLASAALHEADVLILDSPGAGPEVSPALARSIRKFVEEDGGGLFIVFGRRGMPAPAGSPSPLAGMSPLSPLPEPAPPAGPEAAPQPDPGPPNPPDNPVENPAEAPAEIPGPGPQGSGGRKPVETGTAALVILLDKSGSMTGEKIELAKQAAIAAVGELKAGDSLGVIVFDSKAQWAAPLTPVEQGDRIARMVSGIEAGGGTNIHPALRLAHEGLRGFKANIRHVVLISDGFNETVEDFKGLVSRMAEDGVSVSTIGVGMSFDPDLLSSISYWSKGSAGRFDFAKDFDRIPRLVLVHSRWARGLPVEGPVPPAEGPAPEPEPKGPPVNPGPPAGSNPSPKGNPAGNGGGKPGPGEAVPAGESPLQPIEAPVPSPSTAGIPRESMPEARIRKSIPAAMADVVVATADGAPVLAVRSFGKGMIAALASEVSPVSDGLGRWSLLGKFLAQTLRWISFPAPDAQRPRLAYSYLEGGGVEAGFSLDDGREGSAPSLGLADSSGTGAVASIVPSGGGVYSATAAGPFRGPVTATLRDGRGRAFEYRLNPLPARRPPGVPSPPAAAPPFCGRLNPEPEEIPPLHAAAADRRIGFSPFFLAAASLALAFAAFGIGRR